MKLATAAAVLGAVLTTPAAAAEKDQSRLVVQATRPVPVPEPQAKLTSALDAAAARWTAATGNELLQKSVVKKRDQALCIPVGVPVSAYVAAEAKRWVGQLVAVKDLGKDLVLIKIKIGDHASVVYSIFWSGLTKAMVSTMIPGTSVGFSGSLSAEDRCVKMLDRSMTAPVLDGWMLDDIWPLVPGTVTGPAKVAEDGKSVEVAGKTIRLVGIDPSVTETTGWAFIDTLVATGRRLGLEKLDDVVRRTGILTCRLTAENEGRCATMDGIDLVEALNAYVKSLLNDTEDRSK
jgi:hypothetical protein